MKTSLHKALSAFAGFIHRITSRMLRVPDRWAPCHNRRVLEKRRTPMKGGFWENHLATPRQMRIPFRRAKSADRPTQTDVLIAMLRHTRAKGEPLLLPQVMTAGIAQHGARFHELRARGFVIENETEYAPDGRVLSRYYLRFDPEREATRDTPEPNGSACEQGTV